MNVLRPSLLPGLLDSLRNNLAQMDTALFEVCRTFSPGPQESRKVTMLLTGRRQSAFWQDADAKLDISDLKGVVEELLESLGVFGVQFARRETPTTLMLESAEIQMGKQVIGQLGQLQPALGKRYEAREAVYLAGWIWMCCRSVGRQTNRLKPSRFPASEPDVAMLVPQ